MFLYTKMSHVYLVPYHFSMYQANVQTCLRNNYNKKKVYGNLSYGYRMLINMENLSEVLTL